MSSVALMENFKTLPSSAFAIPALIMSMLVMMVLPLPPILLDIFFTFNIAFSLMVLMAGIYSQRPLDFAVFPTVLLVATLLRLSLNVASTRVVLLNGHTGTDAAGQVVQSFGEVVIGGNYTVGLVVFAILVVINFVVVTKGAGRVSEVSARFTLDAMPGKQMAIDADLSAGLITQEQARERRREVEQEADFYGAMDGASKFVRGDAVAGILILFINIIGGLAIGMAEHGMQLSDAMHVYALLTIGDGLVAQIPSLLLSTAAAIVVTRVSSAQDIGEQVFKQVFENTQTLYITGGVIGLLGIIPGMPHLAFLGLGAGVAGLGYYQDTQKEAKAKAAELEPIEEAPTEEDEKPAELNWDDVKPVDNIGLEVGYRLIPLVDVNQSGELLARIKGVRKKLSQDLGFLIPSVHIKDNLELKPSCYRLTMHGVTIAENEIYPERVLAINPGQVFGEIEGIETHDPAFGLPALWIEDDKRELAQTHGFTIVDPSTVVATHLSKVIQDHAGSLLGHEEVQHLLDRLKESAPKLVAELVPDQLSLSTVVKVMQKCLDDAIPVKDIKTIAQTLAQAACNNKDPDALYEAVRIALAPLIVENINGINQELPVITLAPELEQLLLNSMQQLSEGNSPAALEPTLAERLQQALQELNNKQQAIGQASILVVQPGIRDALARFATVNVPGLNVLSFHEIPQSKRITIIGSVG